MKMIILTQSATNGGGSKANNIILSGISGLSFRWVASGDNVS
jgi:hypothetical protein